MFRSVLPSAICLFCDSTWQTCDGLSTMAHVCVCPWGVSHCEVLLASLLAPHVQHTHLLTEHAGFALGRQVPSLPWRKAHSSANSLKSSARRSRPASWTCATLGWRQTCVVKDCVSAMLCACACSTLLLPNACHSAPHLGSLGRCDCCRAFQSQSFSRGSSSRWTRSKMAIAATEVLMAVA